MNDGEDGEQVEEVVLEAEVPRQQTILVIVPTFELLRIRVLVGQEDGKKDDREMARD